MSQTTQLENDRIVSTLSSRIEKVYKVILKEDEDGRLVATCPELQGVVTDGANLNDVIDNVRDAIDAILEDMGQEKDFSIEVSLE